MQVADVERGVRLIAAASKLDTLFWTSLDADERAYYESCRAAAQRALGADVYSNDWSAGQAMTVEQAVEYALEGVT